MAKKTESAIVVEKVEEPKETRSEIDKEQHDESGDVMMESGEDVVIY